MGASWIAIFTRNDISTVSTSKESCFQCHLTVSAESGHLFAADYHYDVLRLFKTSSLKQNSWYLHSYVEFSEIIRQTSLSGFYAISQRKHCMTLQFLNLDTLHQRLRIHSYVTECTTERVWGLGWGRRPTDHSLLILTQASRFKHVYSSTIFKNMFKPSNSIHFYICLN